MGRKSGSESPELAALVRQQAADDATDRLPGRAREVRATDAGLQLDRLQSRPRPSAGTLRLLLGCTPWEGAVSKAVEQGVCVCPVCGDDPPPRTVCGLCCRSGLDRDVALGLVELPGLDVGAVLNPDYKPDVPAPKRGKLTGGVGRRSAG